MDSRRSSTRACRRTRSAALRPSNSAEVATAAASGVVERPGQVERQQWFVSHVDSRGVDCRHLRTLSR